MRPAGEQIPQAPSPASPQPRQARFRIGPIARHPVTIHLAVLIGFILAGAAAIWPRAADLFDHRLPATRDGGSYVWGFWWMARQAEHFSDPWLTHFIAAPAGAQLGLHALMPLPGVLMIPITVTLGPSVSYNLLTALLPGLLCLRDLPGGPAVAAIAGGRHRGGRVLRPVLDDVVAVLLPPEPGGGGAVLPAGPGGRGAFPAPARLAAGAGPGSGRRAAGC